MRTLWIVGLAGLIATGIPATAQTFKIGSGSPARQLATAESVADFETFTGRTNTVTGTVTIDAAKKTGSGRIVIDAATLDTGIAMRNEHMRGAMWLDTEKHKQIVFETTEVRHSKDDIFKVKGRLTLHGVTRTITTDVTAKVLRASDATRRAGFQGDVLQIKTKFPVKLSDFGIKVPAQAVGKVAETVTISLTAFGETG